METTVLHWVATYGYFAIFSLLVLGIVGLPVPDEFLLASCGYLVHQGHLQLAPTVAAAIAGSVSGITCSYIIGRTVGWKFLHSRFGRMLHIRDYQIARVHDWFNRMGHWTLMIGYFVPGVRHFTAIVAGTSKLEYRNFAMYAYGGGGVGEPLCIHRLSLRRTFKQILEVVENNLKLAAAVLAVLVLAYLLFRYLGRRRRA